MKPLLAILASLFLAACSAEHRAALAYADEQVVAFNDTEARTLLRAPCAMRVGAFIRLPQEQQEAVAKLCGR